MLPVFGYDDAPHGHAEVVFDQRARARRQHAPRRGPRLRDRAGPARAGAHPPLHAADRAGRAGAGADVPARADARRLRPRDRRADGDAGAHRREPHHDRAGAAADAEGRRHDGQARQQGGAGGDRDDQGGGAEHGLPRDRLGDPGVRRRRRDRGLTASPTPMPPRATCGSPTGRTRCTATRSRGWNCAATRGRRA